MKKTLLFLTVCATMSFSFGQLTQANEAAIGDQATMFLCDSNLTNYAGTTGTGVTWDYSGMAMYENQTRGIEILNATTTAEAADYPTCTKAFSIQDLVTTYYYSSATERTSEGFVYYDAGTPYKVKWSTNAEILLTYPFAQGNTHTDTYAGTVNAISQDLPATGTINSTIDGTGTLKFPNGINVANVTRLKTNDVATATTPFGNADITREQYEYYDLANGNLPIFVHTKIDLTLPGIGVQTSQLVLSKYDSPLFVGINENTISNFNVYPNPATGEFTVTGNFTTGKVVVYSAQGQEVMSQEITNGKAIQIVGLTSGLYIVKVEANGFSSVKHLSVK